MRRTATEACDSFEEQESVAKPVGGILAAADDAGAVAWFAPEEIGGLKITEGTPEVITRGFAWTRNAMDCH
jgi:hypothetical protein